MKRCLLVAILAVCTAVCTSARQDIPPKLDEALRADLVDAMKKGFKKGANAAYDGLSDAFHQAEKDGVKPSWKLIYDSIDVGRKHVEGLK